MRRTSLLLIALIGGTAACTAILGDFEVSDQATTDGGSSGSSGSSGEGGSCDKVCANNCVSKTDPLFGCATAACTPCEPKTNAKPACTAEGACAFQCNDGFSDCDGNPANGCEATSGTDVNNCGGCKKVCGTINTNAAPKCEASKCVFSCKKDFAHCSPTSTDGCETDLSKDAENCGACGHSCLGGKCNAGKCQPFQLASVSVPSGIAVDATHVYFTFPSVPNIQRVQRDGKCTPAAPCPQDFAGSGVGDPLSKIRGPSAIVSDGTFVYWTNQANGNIGRRSTAITTPPSEIINFGPATSTQPGYITLAGGKVFWTSGFANAEPTAHVSRADLDGKNVTAIANYANPATTFFGFGGITTDGTQIFWASEKSGVFHAPVTTGLCTESSTACVSYGSASGAFGVAVDNAFVYWTEPASGTVRKAPKAGGQSTVIATNQDSPHAITVLDTFVYWANTGNSSATGQSIRRTPQVAAQCTDVGCELVANANAEGLVSANDGIYYTDRVAQGGVYRLAK